jgi:hypothetical protein
MLEVDFDNEQQFLLFSWRCYGHHSDPTWKGPGWYRMIYEPDWARGMWDFTDEVKLG